MRIQLPHRESLVYASFSVLNDTPALVDEIGSATGTLTNMDASNVVQLGNGRQALSFNGSDESVTLGDIGNVKTVVAVINPTTTTEYILDLNGTANIDISSGTLRGNNITSPVLYVAGQVASAVQAGIWQVVAVTTATAVDMSAGVLGKISSNYFAGDIADVVCYSRQLAPNAVKWLTRYLQQGRRL